MSLVSRKVVLTFDDGPGPSTEGLLDVLSRHGARATFFVLGRNLLGEALGGDAERALSITVRALREGHVLGNHTMTHARVLEADDLEREVAECDHLLRRSYAASGEVAPP